MEAAKPALNTKKSIKETIRDDLKEYFKKILVKHLDDRTYNEKKLKIGLITFY